MSKNSEIEKTIQLWHDSKIAFSDLEKKISKYRNQVEKYMDNNGLTKITLDNMTLKRTLQTRENVAKSDIPIDIWKKYKKETIFYTYYITPKK
jgi:hypothetical protein